MSEGNQTFDLQQQAIQEFELKDVKELLNKLKSGTFEVDENIIKNLDKDDNSISETEKKLYEQSKESLNMISFLEGIVKNLEKKEEKKLNHSWNFRGLKKNTESSKNNTNKINKELEKIQPKLIEIGKNYKSFDDLKKDPKGRKEILEIDASKLKLCPTVNFTNGTNITLDSAKAIIAEIETNIIKQKLKGIVNEKQLEKILTGSCDSEKLINLLMEKGFSEKESLELTSNNILSKDVKNSIKIRNLLQEKITINEIINQKNNEERIKILKDKGYNKNIINEILNLLSEKINLNNQKITVQNILSFGLEGYNYFSNEYYLKNTSESIKISDKKKFLEVSKFLKENDKPINFYNLSNPSFRDDFNLIKNFQKISGKKLNYFDTKDIDLSELTNKEKIELLEIVDEENLKTILVENQKEIRKLDNKKYLNQLNIILDNKSLSEDLENEEDNIRIDNTLSKVFKEDYKKAIEIFEDIGFGTGKLLELPKTKEIIFKNPKIINHFIKEDFHFYDIIPQKLQKIHNLKYIDSVLENSDSKSRDLAKLQFSDINNLLIAFNKIKKYSKSNDPFLITKIIQRPIFKLILKNFYIEQSDNIKNLKPQNKERLGEIMGEFKKYDEENKRFIEIYNKSQIEKNIPKDNINYNKDNIFSIKGKEIGNLIMTFSENGFDEIQSKIADIIKDYIKNPSNIKSIFNNEIASKLGEKKYKLFLKELKIIIDSYFLTQINDLTKEEKKGINEKYINKKTGEIIYKNFKIDYLEKLKNTKIKYQKNNQKFDEKEFTKKYVEENFPNLLEKNKVKLINKILYENIGEKKLNKTINNDNLIKATVNGNQDYINKYLKNIDNNFYNDIEEEITEYKKQQLSESSTEKKDQYDRLKETSYPLDTETGVVTISENGKTEKITLTPAERLLVNQNPETLENIVDFYKTLDRIGLSKFWTIKEELFQTIGNKKGVGFKIDSDYLNENEIKIFLNSVLKSIGEDEISPVFKLDSFLSIIERKNNTQIGGKEAIVNNNLSETKLENKFFNKFVNRNSGIIGFNFSKFEQSI